MQEQDKHQLTKEQVREFLPQAVQKAFASYEAFMEKDISELDAKGFSEHHSACKTAIAHANLLLKLAEWAEMGADEMGVDEVVMAQAVSDHKAART